MATLDFNAIEPHVPRESTKTTTLPVATFRVVCIPRPMVNARDMFAMGQGCSIEDVMLEAAYRADMPLGRWTGAVAILDGVKIDKKRWSTVRPHAGQILIVKVVPGAAVVPLIFAVAAATVPTATWGLGLAAGTLGAISAAAGIATAGPLFVSMLAPGKRA